MHDKDIYYNKCVTVRIWTLLFHRCFTVFYPDADAFILKGETDLFSRRLRLQTSEQMSDYAKIVKEEVKQVISLEIGKVAHKLFVTIEDFYSILAHREVTSHLVGCIDECGLYYIKGKCQSSLYLIRLLEFIHMQKLKVRIII